MDESYLNAKAFNLSNTLINRFCVVVRKVIVIGFFGYISGQVNGQTIRTRSIFNLLDQKKHEMGRGLIYFDTEIFKSSPLQIFKLIALIINSRSIFYLGAHKNLRFIFPIIFILSKLSRIDVHFVVIGGWLHDFLLKRPLHRFMLGKIKQIYPQTRLLATSLVSDYGYSNVTQLNNFRHLPSCREVQTRSRDDFEKKLVFIGRVLPEKGLRTIFKIRELIESKSIDCISIDIYGPVSSEYEGEFFSDIEKSEGIIRYKGILQPNEIHKALSGYDLMLFPTQYFTEGFPGSILDAYIAGVPVIATKWKYADEFVVDNVSGIIVPFGDEERFISTVMTVIQDASLLQRLSVGAAEQSAKYTSESAWGVIKKYV